MTYDEVLAHFQGVKPVGEGKAKALCSAHDDHDPSLSIDRGRNGGTVIKCRTGCKTEDVVAKANPPLTMADLAPPKIEAPKYKGIAHPRRDAGATARLAKERVASLRLLCRPASTENTYLASHCVSPTSTLFEVEREVACKHLRSHLPSRDGNLTGDVVLVSFLSHFDEIVSAQLIDASGRKHFVSNAPTAGAYWCTGDLAGHEWAAQLVLIVTEGVAKAIAVAAAMPGAIGIAAMSAGNLKATGEDLRKRFPDAHIIVLGDLGNGEKQARDAAFAIGADFAVPDLDGGTAAKDANDQIRLKGIKSLAATLAGATKPSEGELVTADAIVPPAERRNPRDYPLTEQGASEFLASLNRGSLVYVPEWKSWMQWTGAHWQRDVGGIVALSRTKAISAAFLADAQWAAQNDDARAPVLAKFAARLQQLKVRENVLSGARVESDMAISSSMFDARQDLLNFRNGTYDLGKDTFRDHRREDYQTIVLPYDFDRAAKSSLWERVIADVWPDADTQCFVQRWIGYCLSGSVKEQKFLVLWGRGANGKSVVVKTTLRALGGYARQVGSDVFATSMKDDDDRARKIVPLRGKRLVSTTETKQGQSLDEEMIKSIASPDTQESRLLYCERETWEPTAKVVIMGNHKMRTRGGDYATDRRIILLGCEQRFEGDHCDPDLVDKLAAELPGIINWAIEGHRQWKQHGLGAPTKVQADTREYCGENDVLAPFFEDLCAADSDLFVLRASLYQAFAAWSRGQGNDHPMSSRSFAERVQERGFRPGDKRSVGADRDRTWIGIALRSGQGSGHMGTSGQGNGILFPVLITEKVSGISAQKCPVPTTVALDPLVTLAHCLRAKPDTAASDEDRQALAKHFRGLNGTAEAAGERLWNYWRAAPTPSVTDFLAHEPKAKGGAA